MIEKYLKQIIAHHVGVFWPKFGIACRVKFQPVRGVGT
jgi:hypothetical protein